MNFDGSEGLPTRLLDVGTKKEAEACCSTGNHEEGSLRLIDTKDAKFGHIPLPTETPWKLDGFLNPNWIYYAVLSHRWGKSTEVSSTTKQNIRSRFNSIAYSELCGTFQDAIVVARQLRIRYLWIDSLCIIQDDKDDWRRESAVMGDVYYKSFVTFFAHSYAQEPSNDSDMSQTPKNGSKHTGSNDDVNTKDQSAEDGGRISLYARRSRIFEEDIQNSGLTSRAWIVQERLLSPRIIHFFNSQIYYESHNNGPVRAEDKTMPPTFDKFRECIFNNETRYAATPDVWFKVVERFCSCHLTQSSDKLLAIGGIAQKFHNGSQVPYWAGLFADRAAKGLLWTRRGPKLIRVQGRAPSWSWASADGPIRY
ncbi:heterokaryon incompatibility protein-domain-containing protein, partial [Leptodontidium sp. MPI-SDFR-AT-0119]